MRAITAAIALALVAPLAGADYTPPPQHTAEYTIEKGPLTVARATTKFYPAGTSGYLYRLHLRTTGLASLFSGTQIRERSQGRITDSGYQPRRYVYSRTGGDDPEHARVTFNWNNGRVSNKAGEADWDLSIPDGTLDRVVSPLQLMHDLAVDGEQKRRMTYHIADDGELKSYQVRIGARESVRTAAGRFDAVKVVRRSGEGDRETVLWCAPELDYLPVKVVQREEGEDAIELELESVDGLSADG
jgi:hypothetical protein